MGMMQTTTKARDLYRPALDLALRRAVRRVQRHCCAMCGRPAQTITCTRPECWQALMALPDPALDGLLHAYALACQPLELSLGLTPYQRALVWGIRLAGLALVMTLFGVMWLPALLLLAGEPGR